LLDGGRYHNHGKKRRNHIVVLTDLKIIHNTFAPYYPPHQTTAPPNLIPSLIHRFHSSEGYTLFPDVVPLLKQLRNQQQSRRSDNAARRVVIGVITNSDNRTASILTSLGVRVSPLHYNEERPEQSSPGNSSKEDFDVDFTVLSYDVGAEKPDGRIFGAAEEMLGTLLRREGAAGSPSDADAGVSAEAWSKVYVGDEYQKDVVGATRAGWKAVLVEREDVAGAGRGEREGVEWLGGKRPAAATRPSSIFDVFASTDAVGIGSLKELGKWLPSSRD
jgi:FMN phosphatase YigB (HAD superfamily)